MDSLPLRHFITYLILLPCKSNMVKININEKQKFIIFILIMDYFIIWYQTPFTISILDYYFLFSGIIGIDLFFFFFPPKLEQNVK